MSTVVIGSRRKPLKGTLAFLNEPTRSAIVALPDWQAAAQALQSPAGLITPLIQGCGNGTSQQYYYWSGTIAIVPVIARARIARASVEIGSCPNLALVFTAQLGRLQVTSVTHGRPRILPCTESSMDLARPGIGDFRGTQTCRTSLTLLASKRHETVPGLGRISAISLARARLVPRLFVPNFARVRASGFELKRPKSSCGRRRRTGW